MEGEHGAGHFTHIHASPKSVTDEELRSDVIELNQDHTANKPDSLPSLTVAAQCPGTPGAVLFSCGFALCCPHRHFPGY